MKKLPVDEERTIVTSERMIIQMRKPSNMVKSMSSNDIKSQPIAHLWRMIENRFIVLRTRKCRKESSIDPPRWTQWVLKQSIKKALSLQCWLLVGERGSRPKIIGPQQMGGISRA